MRTFHRFVAIGDSATEGLADPDPAGGYRGWADRLAVMLAQHADHPVEYANLAIRGEVAAEIRALQLDQALAMQPDLIGITAGANDCLGLVFDAEQVADHLIALYAEARAGGACVVTFTLPDPHDVNPLIGGRLRERVLRLNEIHRREARRYGVVLLDLQQYAIAADPRMWFADRLHGNALGHDRVARGVADLLGLPGYADWTDPLPEPLPQQLWRDRLAGDLDWARHHLGPWLVKGIRGVRHGDGVEPKRPVPTVVEFTDHADDAARDEPAQADPGGR